MTPTLFSQIGLICDIVGVLILFKYGLPSPYSEQTLNQSFITIEMPAKKHEERVKPILRRNRIIKIWAHIGLTFLVLGFLGQFVGTLKW